METKTTIIDAMNAHTDAKAGKKLTDVIFLIEQPINDWALPVFAFFPDDIHKNSEDGTHFVCYAHIGQHSACTLEYAEGCKVASPKQYQDLKTELERIGYNLNILKSL